jgi:hypothetical protein
MGESVEEAAVVLIGAEDPASLDAPADHMVERARVIEAGARGMEKRIETANLSVKYHYDLPSRPTRPYVPPVRPHCSWPSGNTVLWRVVRGPNILLQRLIRLLLGPVVRRECFVRQ